MAYWPDTGTGVNEQPERKPVQSVIRKYFTEGGLGQAPTVPGGDWFNQMTNEVLNVLAAAGIEPSKVDDDQLLQAIQIISNAAGSYEALRRSYLYAGYLLRPYPESFMDGATLTSVYDVVLDTVTGKAYSGSGPFPQDVDPGTNPLGGGFTDRSGDLLFYVTYSPSAEAKNAKTYFNIIIGDKPLPFASSIRDAFQVSRFINGKSDCHAFSDKTEISSISDTGTYGTFDSQTVVNHSGIQDHLFSFQDRSRYEGGGWLSSWGNIIWPEMTGSGTVNTRTDIEIKDASGSGGTINSHIGILIKNLSRAIANAAIYLEQSSGLSIYAPNDGASFVHAGNAIFGGVSTDENIKLRVIQNSSEGASAIQVTKTNGYSIYSPFDGKMYLKGKVGFGVEPTFNVPLQVGRADVNSRFFIDVDDLSANSGVIGDHQFGMVVNAGQRLAILSSYDNYAVVPGSDGLQNLGSSNKRWSHVFAATGTINTSDAREKQQVFKLSDAEKRVALRIKDMFVTFKFNDAVELKGDNARTHVGVLAQDVQAAFVAEGLDPHQYSLFCFDEWKESSVEVETTKDDPDAYSKSVEVQKTETVTVTKRRIEIRENAAVQIEYIEQIEQPIYVTLPVFDAKGAPIMRPSVPCNELDGEKTKCEQETYDAPVMETQIRYYKRVITPSGGLYGIRYEELLAFVISAL